MTVQVGLRQTWSETRKTGFLAPWLIYGMLNCCYGDDDWNDNENDNGENNDVEHIVPCLSLTCIDFLFTEQVRHLSTSKESLMSPASPASNGGVYSVSI